MSGRAFLLFLALFSAIALFAWSAETVVTRDGTHISGEVSFDGMLYIIQPPNGVKVKLPKSLVKEVLLPEGGGKIFEQKMLRLRHSPDREEPEAWYRLGLFAQVCKLPETADKCFQEVLELDDNHVGARTALGYDLVKGRWVKREAVPGETENAVTMVKTAAESSGGKPAGGTATDSAPRQQAPSPPSSRTSRVLVPCPDCDGTGVAVWVTCGKCSRSGQPGMVFLGDKFELCPRCAGAVRWPALRCARCRGKGQIDPDKAQLTDSSKQPPKGFRFCTACDGTGFSEWIPCRKCAGSEVTGHLRRRDSYIMCDVCKGRGKTATQRCAVCNSTGVIREQAAE
ncbi:MAG TPA: hypothetical protein ENN09_07535 [Planctomycetes bacterium]|nr:hypothetical protein [Planctomycetota bacterium]